MLTPQSFSTRPARTVHFGGVAKEALLQRLTEAGVRLNEAAHTLFADARFIPSAKTAAAEVLEVSVSDLGLGSGAVYAEIIERAALGGLQPCPLELGPHLRLQFTDQVEGSLGQPATQHCAPPGSLTVASMPLAADDQTPKGFYLRRIEGLLWLRGYRSGPDHRWSPRDMFVFMRHGGRS